VKKNGWSPTGAEDRNDGPPYIVAMLRLTYWASRERLFEAFMARGLTDLNPALLNVFVFPPPDGVRPTELADRLNMTKQALNYLLGQLEALGYLVRRTGKGGRKLVFLTRRGWLLYETQWEALRKLEDEWSQTLGVRRFAAVKEALRQLASPALAESAARFRASEPGRRAVRSR
jgi:DNA-binding MarR family transcriptional regulator